MICLKLSPRFVGAVPSPECLNSPIGTYIDDVRMRASAHVVVVVVSAERLRGVYAHGRGPGAGARLPRHHRAALVATEQQRRVRVVGHAGTKPDRYYLFLTSKLVSTKKEHRTTHKIVAEWSRYLSSGVRLGACGGGM